IYSLGATIYDLLTGTPPFHKGNIELQIQDSIAPSLNQRLAELGIEDSIPDAWEQVVGACLAKDPGQRPHSASDVMRNFETVSASKSGSTSNRTAAGFGSAAGPNPLSSS